jgi:hypothetical protein
VTLEEYRAVRAWNFSTLKHGIKSMAHLRYVLDNPDADPDTTYRAKLRLYHAAILEPDRLPLDFAFTPKVDRRTKEGKAAWQSALDAAAGKTLVDEQAYKAALCIRDNVRAHPCASKLIDRGKSEHTIRWTHTDRDTGAQMPCKGRLDFLHDVGAIVDLKGIGTDPRIVRRVAAANHYHVQQGTYAQGLQAAEDIAAPVYLLTYETAPPFDVAVWRMRDCDLDAGWETMRRVLAEVAKCEASGRWPGRFEEEQELDLPPWVDPDYEAGGAGFEVISNEEAA